MNGESHDPRDIPVLTDTIEREKILAFSINTKDVTAAIVSDALELADSLLHQAVKDIEATLFEHVFDRLRADLPELIDRILAELALEQPAHEVPTEPDRQPQS